jgi:hypothetical protein
MFLTKEMKYLIAFCYSDANALRYEFIFDKPCDYFAVRFFLNEYSYFLVEFDQYVPYIVKVTEWETVKSSYHPSDRVTYLNSYLKKYRDKDKSATLTVEDLTKRLSTIPMPQGFTRDRSSYRAWREVRRASGRF